jgi:phosphoglycerate kinase
MESEVKVRREIMQSSEKPFTAIIGGAKVSDKILIIENLLERATEYYHWRGHGQYLYES